MATLRNRMHGLLRFSERYTKTDMVYLASGGFWLTLGQVGASVCALAFSLVVAHYLPQEVYGSYKYILSVAAIIGAFSLTGIGTALVRSIAKGHDGALREGFFTTLRFSVPMVLIFLGTSAYYAWQGDALLAFGILIAGIATPLINSASLMTAYWSGKKDFRTYTTYWSLTNVASTLATILSVLLTHSLLVLVISYFAASAIANLALFFITVRTIPKDAPNDNESMSYALHLSGINFLNTVSSNIDKIIVFHFLGTAELAIYTFALSLPDQVRAVLKSGARLALPRFAERALSDIQATLHNKLIRFGILIAIATLFYVILAPYVYTYVFPKYIASIPYSQLMALSLFTILGMAPLTALQAHAKKKSLYIHSVTTNIIQIVSSITLVGLYGLWGAAFSVLLNRTVALILPLYLLEKSDGSTEENSVSK